MQDYGFTTSVGRVIFLADGPAPRVFMIHGFKRSIESLRSLADLIPGLGFLLLPGHSGAPELAEAAVETWIQGFGELLANYARPPLIIGESLGAVVGMSVPARAVVAIEPPLSVDRLWPMRVSVEQARSRGVAIGPEYDLLFAEPFTAVLDRICAPTLLIAGDEPLLPERWVAREPSVLTDEDFAAYARHPLVEAQRIEGGHALMDHNRDGVLLAARVFMTRHGYFGDPPSD